MTQIILQTQHLHSVSNSNPTKSPGLPGSTPTHLTVPRDKRPFVLLTLIFIPIFKSRGLFGQNGARITSRLFVKEPRKNNN